MRIYIGPSFYGEEQSIHSHSRFSSNNVDMLLSYASVASIPDLDDATGPYTSIEDLLNKPLYSSTLSSIDR